MFYCDECATARSWPIGMMRSRGPCEVCGAMAICTTRNAALLPPNARVAEEATTSPPQPTRAIHEGRAGQVRRRRSTDGGPV